VTLSALTLANNHADNVAGGMSLTGGGSLTDLVVTTNYGGLGGGGALLSGDYDIRTSTFADNSGFDAARSRCPAARSGSGAARSPGT